MNKGKHSYSKPNSFSGYFAKKGIIIFIVTILLYGLI